MFNTDKQENKQLFSWSFCLMTELWSAHTAASEMGLGAFVKTKKSEGRKELVSCIRARVKALRSDHAFGSGPPQSLVHQRHLRNLS